MPIITNPTMKNLNEILDIYENARAFMTAQGNPRQWAEKNWPPGELVREDIEKKQNYILLDNKRITAVFYYCFGKEPEPCYADITDGEWISDAPYGVIHRLAVAPGTKGAASYCLQWAFKEARHLKVDTHSSNLPMQKTLERNGFVHRGTIYVTEDDMPRMAYEKL